jgi:hypothetical protein
MREESETRNSYQKMIQWDKTQSIHPPIIDGLKSIPVLILLKYWKFTQFATIDLMHLVEGLFRHLIKLWTTAKYNRGKLPRITPSRWKEIDECHLNLKLPSIFRRSIRSLHYWKKFKASECLVFILYTSRILIHFLPRDLWEHHKLLIDSLYDVLQPGKTIAKLKGIHENFIQYVDSFQKIYGVEYMTMNVPMITHIVWSTITHGPLYCYSAFPFEGYNKLVLKCCHGTYRVEKSLSESIGSIQLLYNRIKALEKKGCILKMLRKMKVCV